MRTTGTFIAFIAAIPALFAGCVFELNPKFDPEDSATTSDSASSTGDASGATLTTAEPSTSEATTAETSGQPTTTASPATSDASDTTEPTVGVTEATDPTTDATTDATTGDPEPVCGDGKLEGAEECDDNNQIDKDGCSAACTFEKPIGVVLTDPPLPQFFGPGGQGILSKQTCPEGHVMTGFSGHTTPIYEHITKVKATCASVVLNGAYQVVTGSTVQLNEYLGCCNAENLLWEQYCPKGALVTGLSGTFEPFGVSSLAVHCAHFVAEPTDEGYKLIQKGAPPLGPNGKLAPQPYEIHCGENGVIDALISEQVQDAAILKVTVKCRDLELVF